MSPLAPHKRDHSVARETIQSTPTAWVSPCVNAGMSSTDADPGTTFPIHGTDHGVPTRFRSSTKPIGFRPNGRIDPECLCLPGGPDSSVRACVQSSDCPSSPLVCNMPWLRRTDNAPFTVASEASGVYRKGVFLKAGWSRSSSAGLSCMERSALERRVLVHILAVQEQRR